MDFELSEEQKDIKKAAREFAEGEYDDDKFREWDENEQFPQELWKKACELGFVGVTFPEKYGGQGLGTLENALVMEELARVDMGVTLAAATTFGSEIILAYGREEQKEKYLPPLTKGEAIAGGAFTEPDAGTDMLAASTTAVLDGDEWVINGNKMFITNGTIATFLCTLCVTDPDAEKRTRRHSIIIVDTDREGVERTKQHGKMGIRMSDTAEIAFKDVRVPKENLVGKRGEGARMALSFFDFSGRLLVAAQAIGIAQGSLERTIEHVKERKTFGRPIATNQAIQFRLAEMAVKIEAARNLTYKAAWTVDQGRPSMLETSMAKLYSGKMAKEVVDDCLQMHGGYGYINEYRIERAYRDARILEIYEGVNEAELMTLSRVLLAQR
jgi:alkylation response protein AidB-like acyl-CoA dehydrogenase